MLLSVTEFVMKFKVSMSGNSNYLEKFLKREQNNAHKDLLDLYAKKGVEALKRTTPVDSGHYILDSRYTPPAIMDKILKQLYGTGSTRGVMPSADQLNNLIQTALHGFGHAPFGRVPFGRAP